ncbi:hypothetical protein TVAG_480720 [Trichomonas vaginalis G3]|uniref:Uncharacterized protein n=1 Tax=Trichomonas vaginalis (strain ATCC PRA-98 / G3) TaxID=412133 RepID=A2FLH2_TRIV3|nr:hypothetical protein TVAGG3_0907760 [Trichomonas vaginalis G3]EAX94255.1 hypothetical protein TVAG_480720 [Trichomonas vaginalis G3]KAI5484189.1 hypothetical protein TVAGG3_0907760 [Trichomonas vaginalis G3]|eukprot:XP_001307185.1 hypothetical protein [Trichomonas vaginalis G3]
MRSKPNAGQNATPMLQVAIPDEIAAHFRELARRPNELAKMWFDKYVVTPTAYRYCIMKSVYVSYMRFNLSDEFRHPLLNANIEKLNQTIALIIAHNLKDIESDGKKSTYLVDVCDAKIADAWSYIFDVIGMHYEVFKTGKLNSFGMKLLELSMEFSAGIHSGKYPDTGLQIPSRDEYHNWMGQDLFFGAERAMAVSSILNRNRN